MGKILAFVVLVIGIFSGIYLYTHSRKDLPKYTGPIEKIAIGNVKEYSIFNVIAQEKNYFSQNGLDATVNEYDSGPAAVKDLLAGRVDMALASDNAGVQTIFTHPELRIVAQFVRNRVFSVVVRKDKGIINRSDLKGKKIGVTKKSAGEFLLSQFLTLQNLTQKDVVIVDLSPAQIKTEIQKGTIEAGVLFEPNVFDLIKILGDKVSVWPIEDGYYTFGLIYTTQSYIQAHPVLVQRYLQSLIDAQNYVTNYPTETKDLIGKRFGYSKEYIEYSWEKNNHNIALDQELLLSLENIADWVISNKLTTKTVVPNYLNFIYFDALEKVKPESITIIR